jgi:hypothetical protein
LKIGSRSTFDVIVVDQYMQEAGGMMLGTDVDCAMRQSKIESIIIGCPGNDIDDLFFDAGADWVWKSNQRILSQLHGALPEKKLHGRSNNLDTNNERRKGSAYAVSIENLIYY